ncbi:hypothetical protein CASFOL_011701 [Castilleja foliolosa]|uniref:Uncharacterized protein n=1 Tax=Castilleja foliolosa TaxID=1961234 RepID=A0ABD3DW84_9LAMI
MSCLISDPKKSSTQADARWSSASLFRSVDKSCWLRLAKDNVDLDDVSKFDRRRRLGVEAWSQLDLDCRANALHRP